MLVQPLYLINVHMHDNLYTWKCINFTLNVYPQNLSSKSYSLMSTLTPVIKLHCKSLLVNILVSIQLDNSNRLKFNLKSVLFSILTNDFTIIIILL